MEQVIQRVIGLLYSFRTHQAERFPVGSHGLAHQDVAHVLIGPPAAAVRRIVPGWAVTTLTRAAPMVWIVARSALFFAKHPAIAARSSSALALALALFYIYIKSANSSYRTSTPPPRSVVMFKPRLVTALSRPARGPEGGNCT